MIMRASCDASCRFHDVGSMLASCYGDLAGPLAIMICKPRQARKGATVAVSYVPGCGWLGRHPLRFFLLFFSLAITAWAVNTSVLHACPLVSISAIGRYNRALFLANRLLL